MKDRPMAKELLSTPFAADILLHLLEKQECSIEELREEACDGESPEKALKFLRSKGLIETGDGIVRLTFKGKEAAEIIDRIESMFSADQQ